MGASIALALGMAETLEATDVFIGVNAVDYSGYPDCRPEFIRAFEALSNLATRAGVAPPDLRPRTRDLLWSDVEDVYAAILRHPFVTGLTDGSLPREAFRHYIVQDAHYLRGYARAHNRRLASSWP